jgi:Zn-dependent peptidase ImmA (M78 family)/DNA-binding XRE family transcriptional regulator
MPRPDDAAVGARLRKLRTGSGFSQEQVAAALSIPRSAISLIESGERSLASSELARLATVYGWPVEKVLFGSVDEPTGRPGEDIGTVIRYFRTAGAIAPAGEEPWLDEAEEHWRNYALLEEKVFGAQRWDLPIYPVPPGRPHEQGEHLGAQERRRLGLHLAPIRSMIDLLEGEGIKVLLLPFDTEGEVAGCYFFSEELGPCVVVNKTDPPARRRFTEAHEYCHFLVDRESVEGEICGPSRRREYFEMRANSFAAALLLPPGGVYQALEEADIGLDEIGPEDVVHLMYRFGVSREAILWRLLNLRLISSPRRKELSGFSVSELSDRLGYELEPGQSESAPDRYRRLAVDAWRTELISTKELGEVLGLPAKDIKKIFRRQDVRGRRPTKRPLAEPEWL